MGLLANVFWPRSAVEIQHVAVHAALDAAHAGPECCCYTGAFDSGRS